MLQFRNENLVIVIAGCSGSGKSTYAIRHLQSTPYTCRFIFDASGEYAAKLRRRPARSAAELKASIQTGFVVFDPHTIFPGDVVLAFDKFCEWYWTMCRYIPGQKIALADEVWKFISPMRLPKSLAMIVQDGRKVGAGLICTTQRPNRLNEAITGEATEFVGFTMRGENKLSYLRKNFDEFPVDDLPKLPLLHFIHQKIQTGKLTRGVLRF